MVIASDPSLQSPFVLKTTTSEEDEDETLYWSNLDEAPFLDADLTRTPPPVVIPPRYFEQPPSASGLCAYTLFGGPNQGVFYNWYEHPNLIVTLYF